MAWGLFNVLGWPIPSWSIFQILFSILLIVLWKVKVSDGSVLARYKSSRPTRFKLHTRLSYPCMNWHEQIAGCGYCWSRLPCPRQNFIPIDVCGFFCDFCGWGIIRLLPVKVGYFVEKEKRYSMGLSHSWRACNFDWSDYTFVTTVPTVFWLLCGSTLKCFRIIDRKPTLTYLFFL